MAGAWRRDADPDKWGVAVCTTDGQVFLQGDTDDYFSIQSSSKPLTYALALKERGEKFVHDYVGGGSAPASLIYACRTFSARRYNVERCGRQHEGSRQAVAYGVQLVVGPRIRSVSLHLAPCAKIHAACTLICLTGVYM